MSENQVPPVSAQVPTKTEKGAPKVCKEQAESEQGPLTVHLLFSGNRRHQAAHRLGHCQRFLT